MHITIFFQDTLQSLFNMFLLSSTKQLPMFCPGLQHGSAGPWSAAIMEVGPQLPRTTSRDGTPGQTDAGMLKRLGTWLHEMFLQVVLFVLFCFVQVMEGIDNCETILQMFSIIYG